MLNLLIKVESNPLERRRKKKNLKPPFPLFTFLKAIYSPQLTEQ